MRGIVAGLLLCMSTPMDQGDANPKTPRQQYEALLKESDAADEAWNKRFTLVENNVAGVDWEARYRDWPRWSFAPRFLAIAEEAPDDPVALDALLWVVDFGGRVPVGDREVYQHYSRALELLARGYRFDDKRVRETYRSGFIYGSPPTEKFLRTVLEQSEDREVRGVACLALAKLLASKRESALSPWFDDPARTTLQAYTATRLEAAYTRYFRQADPKAASDEAERWFERAAKEYGDLVYQAKAGRDGGDLTIAEAARSELHELRALAVGRPAPEIEGEDADGKRFKLRDFRGKVVALVFSGNWCPPCREMYPQERALIERLKGRPFVLLGINTDRDKETLRKSIAMGEITWRCWWDGEPGGPICSAWNVRSFPFPIVLDAEGTIRYRRVRGERLERAVDALLKEREK